MQIVKGYSIRGFLNLWVSNYTNHTETPFIVIVNDFTYAALQMMKDLLSSHVDSYVIYYFTSDNSHH